MKECTIHLCLACDDRFAVYAAVVLLSVWKTRSNGERFCVWIISDGISVQHQQWLTQVLPQMEIHFVSLPEGFMAQAPVVQKHISKAAYARLAIGSVLPKNVRRVIYLDCDLVVLESLRPLWEWDLQGKIAAGLEDWGVCLQRREGTFRFYENEIYIGSGLLVIDLERWRKEQAEEKLAAYTAHPAYPIRFEDQDVLNGALHGSLGILPARWDVVFYISEEDLRKRHAPQEWIEAQHHPAVVHFAGWEKPWIDIAKQPYTEVFRQYMRELGIKLQQTPLDKKMRMLLRYWWRHPVCFCKPSFYRKLKRCGWSSFL